MWYVIVFFVALILGVVLGRVGYIRASYGFATGRHWIILDGKMIYQGVNADVRMRDQDVHKLGYCVLDKGKHWTDPMEGDE
jgi:hypothetical protein